MISTFFYHLSNPIYLLIAMVSGAIGTLSFSPYDFWPAGFISLFCLQLILLNKSTIKAATIGFFWGLGLFGSGIHWVYVSIATFGGMPSIINVLIVVLLIVYLSLYPMLFAILLNFLFLRTSWCRLSLAAPSVWHVTEFLRGYILTGFPWLQFGYTQINGPLKNLAPIAGVESITFFMMVITGLLVHAFYHQKFKSLLAAFVILLLPWQLPEGQWYKIVPHSKVRIAMVQGNIPQLIKWNPQQFLNNINTYRLYSKKLIGKASIIIWPESAITDLESNQQLLLHSLDKKLRKYGTSLVTGIINSSLEKDNHYHNYNSLITLGNQQVYYYNNQNRYRKNHLVPFGEFVPFESLLRPLAPFFDLPMSSFSRGPYIQPQLKVAGYNFTSAICYEIILGEQIRANFRSNTHFLLTISNDAWFGHSIGPWQHFQMARMRALELGRPLLHSTNNGITALVNANGNIEDSLPPFKRQILDVKVILTTGDTPYSKVGIWPVWMLTLVSLIISIGCRNLQLSKF